ncbi:hypothetical protein E2P65_02265 [Candidatus Bathyarchaeota archaeon]|nr:hypothetical protein E2P65_02265 [Candidatus Bathyarchaeota archaeon]
MTQPRGGGAILKGLYRSLIQRIRRYDDESGRRRPHLWYIGEIAPEIEWIDNSIEADFRRIDKWQNPSIRFSYTGKDLIEEPKWEPRKRGFMEQFWWPAVISLILIIFVGIVWGLMNRVGT